MKGDLVCAKSAEGEDLSAWFALGLSGQLAVLFDVRQIEFNNV